MWITRPDCSASFCWVQVQKAVVSDEVIFFDRIHYLVIKLWSKWQAILCLYD